MTNACPANVWNHDHGCSCATTISAGAAYAGFPTSLPAPDPAAGETLGEPLTPAMKTVQGNIIAVDAVTEPLPADDKWQSRAQIHMSGMPWVSERTHVTVEEILSQRSEEDQQRINALLESNEPATLLVLSTVGSVSVVEGRPFRSGPGWSCSQGTQLVLPKGSRSKASKLDPNRVVSAASGFGHAAELTDQFCAEAAVRTPNLKKITSDGFQDLPEFGANWSGDAGERIAAVYMINNPDFNGGTVHGCLFMATDIQRGDGPNGQHIINGQFWAASDSGLYSEASSMYSGDLIRRGAQLTDYTPGSLSYRDSWKDFPTTRAEAYRRVLQTNPHPATPVAQSSAPVNPSPHQPAGWGTPIFNELPF